MPDAIASPRALPLGGASKSTGLRPVDHRLAAGAPAPVAAVEGPRTRVVRWPGAAGAMDFGTFQVPQPGRSSCLHTIVGQWKHVGVVADLKLKEGNAFIASNIARTLEKMVIVLRGGPTTPDPYLVATHLPGQALNIAGVNDPKLTEMIQLQRRTLDDRKRREIFWVIE